jgi:DNA-binding transcriptional regulator GbsR (MarR family)
METRIHEIIEKWGVYYKRYGHQPMMGRLMAYLMIAEPPHQTFEEIAAFLRASKSSISNTLNLMSHLGMVDYVRFPGDRKRYFRLNANIWSRFFESAGKEIQGFRELLAEVLTVRGDNNPAFTKELNNLLKLITVFEKELPHLLAEWKQQIEE